VKFTGEERKSGLIAITPFALQSVNGNLGRADGAGAVATASPMEAIRPGLADQDVGCVDELPVDRLLRPHPGLWRRVCLPLYRQQHDAFGRGVLHVPFVDGLRPMRRSSSRSTSGLSRQISTDYAGQ
jgi:hypothetical protein